MSRPTQGYLSIGVPEKINNDSPWSYPDAAAGAAAAASAAASAVCIYHVIVGGRFVPPYKYIIKYIQQKQQQQLQLQQHLDKTRGILISFFQVPL